MDRILQRILRFDRFTLDLRRGSLRQGNQDIDLPPKTFEVLCYLVSNAGRLVRKQELFEAAWPAVTVSDDSLVQCIRELRVKLGDDKHHLIKTVPRRGYLLDTKVTIQSSEAPWDGAAMSEGSPAGVPPNVGKARGVLGLLLEEKWRRWVAIGSLLTGALGVVSLLALLAHTGLTRGAVVETLSVSPQLPVANELFTAGDAKRISELAMKKQLPLPEFQIGKPAGDVRERHRRFVGIWMSDTGWLNSYRQMMLIVTSVDADGIAEGYGVNGPPQSNSHIQTPPKHWRLKMRISGDSLSYSDTTGRYVASLTPQNQLTLKATFWDRVTPAWVLLEPVWTLVEAERAASMETIAR
jgi:DNA-binding winged helix-turn-helix (wHTH) protein